MLVQLGQALRWDALSPLEIAARILLVLTSVCLVYVFYMLKCSTLSHIKGPFPASISRLWLVYHALRADMHTYQPFLHRKYGKFVRIAPDEVSISDPQAIKEIYGVNSGFTKTEFYDPFGPRVETPMGELFSLKDEKRHALRRRLVSHIYSMTNIVKSEGYMNLCVEEFMKALNDSAQEQSVIDFGECLQRFAFDVIGELFYGSMFGFLKERRDVGGYMATLDGLIPFFTVPLMVWLWPGYRAHSKKMVTFNEMAAKCVHDRQQNPSGRDDILNHLFALNAERPDFTIEEIFNDSFDALGAGSDTTAVAMRSAFYHVMKDEAIYARLQAEIDEADKQGRLSNPVTFNEAMQMPYLVAVCKEAMRVFPSVGMTLPRHVPASGRLICGQFFPEGVKVGVNAFVVHRDQGVFGYDAESFNPDRWFRPEAKDMDRYMFQAS
ncbi:hypothetical protein AYO22_11220 [Fonsecaea multimorphosa]|nr:hypothetical protein AYO22_11220 [Fonsecaea multimorphosa]